MPSFFLFSQLPDLEGRIAQYTVEDTTSGILTVNIALIGKPYHFLGQLNGKSDIMIAGFHQAPFSQRMANNDYNH